MMVYKGYLGNVEYDDSARIFHGEIINIKDVITFQGKSVDELENAFHESIDDYINWCREEGEKPEKPYSGRFNLRLSPQLHREVAITAKKMNLSINKFVEKALEDELNTVNA